MVSRVFLEPIFRLHEPQLMSNVIDSDSIIITNQLREFSGNIRL